MTEILTTVPAAEFGLIGGSSTLSLRFPEDIPGHQVRVLAKNLQFETPYGPSPLFKLLELPPPKGPPEGQAKGQTARQSQPVRALTVRMHGWRHGVTRADASRQLFWVFQQAGVKQVLAEGGVGSVSHLLELRDIVIANDYIDLSMRQDVGLGGPYLLIMRDPVCRRLGEALAQAAEAVPTGRGEPHRVFRRGVYAVTDGRHFESRAEVQAMKHMGADVVGQSMAPEVYLAREIGACFAGAYMVVNYAEGIIRDWEHKDLADIFYGEAEAMGRILLKAWEAAAFGPQQQAATACGCQELRKETLLKDIPE